MGVILVIPAFSEFTGEEVKAAQQQVVSLIRGANPNQFDALTWFVLTTPKGTLAKSNLLKFFNEGFIFAAAAQFRKFAPKSGKGSVKIPALRAEQSAHFLRPYVAVNNEVKNG
jgi:GH24 family phage-related lysozyme (muramidase)